MMVDADSWGGMGALVFWVWIRMMFRWAAVILQCMFWIAMLLFEWGRKHRQDRARKERSIKSQKG